MKVLIAGEFKHFIHEESLALALTELGVEVRRVEFCKYPLKKLGKVEYKFVYKGPRYEYILRDIYRIVRNEHFDAILFWRPILFDEKDILKLNSFTSAIKISYNNDDPFSPKYTDSNEIHLKRLWARFVDAIPAYDVNLVFRKHNINDYVSAGGKDVRLFLPSYISKLIPRGSENNLRREKNVVFVGHYTPYREEIISYLINDGIQVCVFGDWPERALGDYSLIYDSVETDEYYKILSNASFAISLYSRLNRDQYTRRCFEIPACSTVLVSEKTDWIIENFVDMDNAIIFSHPSEASEKIKLALNNEELLNSLMSGSKLWSQRSSSSTIDRANELIKIIESRREIQVG